uniref:Uncharacterized protein n=1 Tax=Anguilla anguilla TaxID=7936 RepID=A0A0E9SYA8_ANGAN
MILYKVLKPSKDSALKAHCTQDMLLHRSHRTPQVVLR